MCDMFTTDIFLELEPPRSEKYNLIGVKIPTNQDYYFISKWHEIFDRYTVARLFLRKTQEDNWDYWFNPLADADSQKAVEMIFQSNLYETALINYNILVDLSWTITYVSAEYVLYKFDNNNNIVNVQEVYGMSPIEEAYELLRKTENGVTTPHAEGNPFDYLKKTVPAFEEAIDMIIDFWSTFSNSNIRKLYNYIKHKGKPIYSEINKYQGGKIMDLFIGKEQYPSDIRDVQRIISLKESIQELIDFDDNLLFPYMTKLIKSLEQAVEPSPMAYI